MVNHKYSREQILSNIAHLRKKIFFLLICVDPQTKNQFEHININDAITNAIDEINGLNIVLECKYPEFVSVVSLLETAKLKVDDFSSYRKVVLEAGSKMQHLEEVI